jgi:hypothetical protein
MTEDSEKQHVEIKMNTRGQEKHNLIMNTREQDERNLAEVLRFKQFYYWIFLSEFFLLCDSRNKKL